MDPFVEQLKQLCASYPTRNKWVFVPSHAIGRTLGERLTLEGTSWLNVRFVTPLDVALRMAGPFLVERGIEPSEEGLGPAGRARWRSEAGDERGAAEEFSNVMLNEMPLRTLVTRAGRKQLMQWPCVFSRTLG